MTAAKQLVSGTVAIDMLAGPSELVVLADGRDPPARGRLRALLPIRAGEAGVPHRSLRHGGQTAGGTGGTGAAGATGGAGGTAGAGGEPSGLVDGGLIVRYFIDEAASGQTPLHLVDAATLQAMRLSPMGHGARQFPHVE